MGTTKNNTRRNLLKMKLHSNIENRHNHSKPVSRYWLRSTVLLPNSNDEFNNNSDSDSSEDGGSRADNNGNGGSDTNGENNMNEYWREHFPRIECTRIRLGTRNWFGFKNQANGMWWRSNHDSTVRSTSRRRKCVIIGGWSDNMPGDLVVRTV